MPVVCVTSIPVLVGAAQHPGCRGRLLCRPSGRSRDHAIAPVAARYFRGRTVRILQRAQRWSRQPRTDRLIAGVSECRDRRWIILAVLFAARAATGFQFQSIGSATNLLMDGSRHRLCRDRHAARRLSVARRHRGVSGRTARPARPRKDAGTGRPAADGHFRPGAELFRRSRVRAGCAHRSAASVRPSSSWSRPRWWRTGSTTREIVLAMSLLQMSWPFGAMIALPIQAWIGQSLGWPR